MFFRLAEAEDIELSCKTPFGVIVFIENGITNGKLLCHPFATWMPGSKEDGNGNSTQPTSSFPDIVQPVYVYFHFNRAGQFKGDEV